MKSGAYRQAALEVASNNARMQYVAMTTACAHSSSGLHGKALAKWTRNSSAQAIGWLNLR